MVAAPGRARACAGLRSIARQLAPALVAVLLAVPAARADVHAALEKGSLVLTGGASGDDAVVVQQGWSAAFPGWDVAAQGCPPDAGPVTVQALSGSVNGGSQATFPGLTGDLEVELGAGLRTLSLHDLCVPGDLKIQGSGPTQVLLNLSGVGGSVDVGLESPAFESARIRLSQIAGRVVMRARDGDELLGVETTSIGRDLKILPGDGGGSISVFGTALGGRLQVSGGRSGSASDTRIEQTQVAADLRIAFKGGERQVTVRASQVTGATTLSAGAEPAVFALSELHTSGIKAKGAAASLVLESVSADGSVDARSAIQALQAPGAGDSTIAGSLKASTGGAQLEHLQVGRDLRVELSEGDSARIATSQVSGNLQIRAKRGPSIVEIEQVAILGSTAIQTGSEADGVSIDDSTFAGDVEIRTGDGADIVEVEARILPGESRFDDLLRVRTEGADDHIFLGGYSGLQRLIFEGPVQVDCGASEADAASYGGAAGSLSEPIVQSGCESFESMVEDPDAPAWFLLAGQSNAVGASSQPTTPAAGEVFRANSFDWWPSIEDPHVHAAGVDNRSSSWPSFARNYGNAVSLVATAVSATCLRSWPGRAGHWDPATGAVYAQARQAWLAAGAPNLRAVLWLQGECDGQAAHNLWLAGQLTRQQAYDLYYAALLALADAIWLDYRAPLVVSPISLRWCRWENADCDPTLYEADDPKRLPVHDATVDAALVHPHILLGPSADDLRMMPDATHTWDVEELGRRWALTVP